MRYQAVVFDLYDTLVTLDTAAIEAGRRRLAELAGVEPAAFAAQWRATSRDRMVGRLGGLAAELRAMLGALGAETASADAALLERLAEAERKSWVRAARPFAGALETLRALGERGLGRGLVSNCSSQAGAVVRAHGLDALLDALVLSCEAGVAKPDPAVYRRACELLGVRPETCVYVADGAGGELVAARSLGMLAVKVEHPDRRPEAGRDQEYDVRIERLEEVLRIVGG